MTDPSVGSDWSLITDGTRSSKRSSDNGEGGREPKSPRSESRVTSEFLEPSNHAIQDVSGESPVEPSPLDGTKELGSGGGASGELLRGRLESAKATPSDQAPWGWGRPLWLN